MKYWMRGNWLNKNLLVTVRSTNGSKEILIYGKVGHRLKQTLREHGYRYNRTAQRWERTVGKTMRIPDFLKEKEE